jgi:hypothetical protein
MIEVMRRIRARVGKQTGWRARGILAMAVLATLGCSDSTAPSSAIELRVPQELLVQVAPGSIKLQWVVHNQSSASVNVAFSAFTLEQEVSPNTWSTARVSDSVYLGGADIPPGQELTFPASFTGLEPGRYRITVPFSGQGASSRSRAFSNVFVVT